MAVWPGAVARRTRRWAAAAAASGTTTGVVALWVLALLVGEVGVWRAALDACEWPDMVRGAPGGRAVGPRSYTC